MLVTLSIGSATLVVRLSSSIADPLVAVAA